MSSLMQAIISVLALLGIGGIVTTCAAYLLDRRKEREFKVLEQKERRYKSCLLYMDAFFEPENIKYLSSRQHDIDNARDVLEYLKMEYHEMILYASSEVVLSVKTFIDHPTRDNFLRAILTMRQDLSSANCDLNLAIIKLDAVKTERNCLV